MNETYRLQVEIRITIIITCKRKSQHIVIMITIIISCEQMAIVIIMMMVMLNDDKSGGHSF